MPRRILAIAIVAIALVMAVIYAVSQNGAGCSGSTVPSTDSPNATFEVAADGFTLRIARDEQFQIGALDWLLRIGDVEFYGARFPDGSLDAIVFDVPSEALQHLSDGDPISVIYGNPKAAPFEVNPDPPALPSDPIANYVAAKCG